MRNALVLLVFASCLLAQGPSFSSGSNGSDGALNLTTPGTIIFDPRDTATFGKVLDPDGDNVYHFTTITIGAGVTLKFTAQIVPGSIYWLAQGAVQIDGTLDFNGADGVLTTPIIANRAPAIAGSGGYSGGVSAYFPYDGSAPFPPQPGTGPLGGAIGSFPGCTSKGQEGTFSGNQFLVPLVGGSGGGGACNSGGSAGGGAILLASSTSITLNGLISAHSGRLPAGAWVGGSGSGGAIRIAANSFLGNGSLSVLSFVPSSGFAQRPGRIRIEAYQNNFTGTIVTSLPGFGSGPNTASYGTPFNTFVPTAPQSLRLVSISGVPVPANPNGSFTLPDVSINSAAPVPVVVAARNIPLGTVVNLLLYSENGSDQTVPLPPLTGTLSLSTAQTNITFPSGFSRGFVRAQWTQ